MDAHERRDRAMSVAEELVDALIEAVEYGRVIVVSGGVEKPELDAARSTLVALIASQAAEIERLNADAGRYRFLKNNMSKTRPYGDVYAQENEAFTNRFVRSYTQRCWDIRFISTDQFDNIDDAIDAALRGDTP